MCCYSSNSRFDSDVGSKWHFDAKEESKWLKISVERHLWGVNLHSNSFKSQIEMTPWVVKMTLLIGLKWLYRWQPKRSQNDSPQGLVLGSRKRLLWLTVYEQCGQHNIVQFWLHQFWRSDIFCRVVLKIIWNRQEYFSINLIYDLTLLRAHRP